MDDEYNRRVVEEMLLEAYTYWVENKVDQPQVLDSGWHRACEEHRDEFEEKLKVLKAAAWDQAIAYTKDEWYHNFEANPYRK